MQNITVFTGTRAEYGLLYWLLKDIQADEELILKLLVSGMHLAPEFGSTVIEIEKDGFNIDEKVEMLLASDTASGIIKSMGLGAIGYADALVRLHPDLLVVLGDRFEALAVVQAALILKIPVAHIHGGEITEGAYDDSIRHAITKMASFHFTSNEQHRKRVIQMGESPETVFNVGAIGLDHLKRDDFLSVKELSESLNFDLDMPYFLVTYHPVTLASEAAESTFKNLLKVIDQFPEKKVILTYPNADNGGRVIIALIEDYVKRNPQRVFAIPSLGFVRYLSAVRHSSVVIGNSSSGIIEVPSFQKPSVNIGIRQQGRLSSKSVINCETDCESISKAISTALNEDFLVLCQSATNPYGSGGAAKKICKKLKTLNRKPFKHFFDLEFDHAT